MADFRPSAGFDPAGFRPSAGSDPAAGFRPSAGSDPVSGSGLAAGSDPVAGSDLAAALHQPAAVPLPFTLKPLNAFNCICGCATTTPTTAPMIIPSSINVVM